MPRATTTAAPAPAPAPKGGSSDPIAALLAQALAETAKAQGKAGKRQTAGSHSEALAQPLTARDAAAVERMGWGRLSSSKPAEPQPLAPVKNGPKITANFAELTDKKQAETRFWAGLCGVIRQNKGKIWLPEVAAAAAQTGVFIPSPSQLATRLCKITGCPVSRPAAEAGWLICQGLTGIAPQPAEGLWIQVWNLTVQQFGDAVVAEA